MNLGDFVQLAGGASALIAALGWAVRQGTESFAALAKARAAREQAEAAKITAEAAQDVAGAMALKDALERVDRLEARVGELERTVDERDDQVRHLQGQQAVLQLQVDAEKRARLEAEGLVDVLRRELNELRNDVTSGLSGTGTPTPMLPPPRG